MQLKSKDDVALVMTNKSKLMEYDNLDKVHIEAFMSKADVITRDNWNTIIRLMGNAGKGVRVAGTGRIVRRSGLGEQRLQADVNASGGEAAVSTDNTARSCGLGDLGWPDNPKRGTARTPSEEEKEAPLADKRRNKWCKQFPWHGTINGTEWGRHICSIEH